MDLQGLFTIKTTLSFTIIYIIFTTSVEKTASVDSKYEDCVPRNCGKGPNISYPFRLLHHQKSYCGYPKFEVKCKDEHPVVTISGDDYVIRDIFYANSSFSLENAASFANKTCPVPLHNFSLDHTPFGYSPSYMDLNFFYNCTAKHTGDYTYPVECATNTTAHSFAVFHKDALEATGFASNSCQSLVNAPVGIGDSYIKFSVLIDMNYTEILRVGFHLSWISRNCSNCEQSGGHCGFTDNEFLCYCTDGPHRRTCKDGTQNLLLRLVIGFAGAGLGVMLVLGVIFICRRRRHKQNYVAASYVSRNISSDYYSSSMAEDLENRGSVCGVHLFGYAELVEATNNFDASKELGDGGFGTVYYGKLKDGRDVAVKRLYENNFKRVEQFMNEVKILTLMHHPNLVILYGCTSRHSQELLLVYEYISNGTVADHLHGDGDKHGSLNWSTRLKIAIETANALVYLHASDVVHRDVKTTNILLDNNFCVKVADFGLSRLFPTDMTHVSTAPQGTPGYVDPDYHQCYQLTDKSDVYSLGVVMIELISSKPAVDITRHRHEINLSNMAITKIQNGQLHELVDMSLGYESDRNIKKMINAVAELAFQCLQSDKDLRPTMVEVFDTLVEIQKNEANAVQNATGLPHSPDSVITVKWASSATTPNQSV